MSTDSPRIRAHQWVWINIHGEIPKGYHIHHKDGNKSNNLIENLLLIRPLQHVNLHMTDERRERQREQMEKIRPLTKEWHASEEGRAWHRLHAIQGKFGKNERIEYKCQQCGKPYHSSKLSNAKFCSNPCKSKWRRDHKLDHIERSCIQCSKMFNCNRYAKNITCGKYCAARYRWRNKASR